jgi:DHA1 family inner membrane transport protein
MNETLPGARRLSSAAAVAASETAIGLKISRDRPGRGEWALLLVLATIQFTIAVDFVIMLPLGPQLMRAFGINTAQFNFAVAAYAFAASFSGLAAGFFLDRFGRKRALLGLYAGFTIGTLFCGLATSHHALVAARALAGVFGGIVGGNVLAIVGDVIPEHRRGAAVGVVMSAFSISQIVGVPFGLFLANRLNWHTPFFALAGLSALILLAAAWQLPVLRGHLKGVAVDESSWQRMRAVVFNSNHLVALALTAIITVAGYLVFTDLATFLVKNVGITEHQLPWVYVVGGSFTIFSMNGIGRLADRYGKRRVYTIMIFFAAASLLAVTHLPPVSLGVALIFTTAFTVCMSGRFVPAMALITASVESRHRGGFMSVNSSVANLMSAVGSALGGILIKEVVLPGGETRLVGYPLIGWIAAILSIASLLLIYRLRQVNEAMPSAEAAAKACPDCVETTELVEQ